MKTLMMKAETDSGNKFISALNDFHKLTTYVKENGGKVLQKTPLPKEAGMTEEISVAEGVTIKILVPSEAACKRQTEWMEELYREGRTDALPTITEHFIIIKLCARIYNRLRGKMFQKNGNKDESPSQNEINPLKIAQNLSF